MTSSDWGHPVFKTLKYRRWVPSADSFVGRAFRLMRLKHLLACVDRNTQYDRQTIQVMKRVLRRDSACIDIGAHKGSILSEMLKLAPDGSHHAFEPLPYLAANLRQTFPKVTIHEKALSDYTGVAEFIYVENAPGYSGLKARIYDRPDPLLRRISVAVARLDDLIPDSQNIDFIKLDIEGGEFHALRGAIKTIRRCQPIIVLEAGHKSTGQYGIGPDQFYDFITLSIGYSFSTMARWLGQHKPYCREEFYVNWQEGDDYYFIAFPPQ